MPILAQCGSCQKKFKAGDQLAGKKVKCPQCGSVITIPQPQPPAAASSPPPPPPPSPFQSSVASILDEEDIPLQAMPKPAATPAQPSRLCPGCGAGLSEQAVLCVHCGFDTRSGRKLEVGSAADEEASGSGATGKKKKKRSRETSQGLAFLYGSAASFAFAMVGAVMWWIAFYFTGFEFGIIAWVLGGMAGGGMAMAYGHEEALGGLAAAAMAFLGIWAANAMILASVFANPDKFMEFGGGDEVAEEEVFDEEMLDEGAGDEFAGDAAEDEAVGTDVPSEEFPEEEMPEVPAGAVNAIMGIALLIGSFVMCFAGFYKILWLIFALSTAYKIGSGGSWTD